MSHKPSIAALVVLAACLGARAQDEAPEPEAEPTRDPAPELVTDHSAELLETPPTGGVVFPAGGEGVASAIPSAAFPGSPPPTGTLLPEGTHLLKRRGILVPVGQERWAFVFDSDDRGDHEPPMFVMACTQLADMLHAVRARSETVTFFIDGEVFVHDGVNHILPIRHTVGTEPDHTNADEVDAAIEAAGALLPDEKDPSVESIMDRLDRASAGDDADRPARGARPDPGASDLLPEQTPIVSRRGRLERRDGARWAFVPDNDADASAERERRAGRALLLQPCLNTQELERLAEQHADRVAFIVSGAVFAFEGRNYLLPTMFLMERDTGRDLVPAQ